MPAYALSKAGVRFKLRFASDSAPYVKKFLAKASKPDILYGDVLQRDPADMPYTNAYIWGPPCVGFSTEG
eukprot:1983922-Alexandrium_andersonii.AAC.1